MTINKNEPKAMTEHISCDCKYIFNSTICKCNNKTKYESKIYCNCKKCYSWNPRTCICENSKNLKVIPDTSIVMDTVSTISTNTIARKNTNTASITCQRN